MGTEFNLYDHGINPEKLSKEQRDGSGSQVRAELATVLYKQNVLGSRGPRKMKVIVPNVDEHGNRVTLKPVHMEDTMLERYKAGKECDDVQVLKNKQPKWNDQVGAYVLNFNGRVTRASVKNFQLCNVARDRAPHPPPCARALASPLSWHATRALLACVRACCARSGSCGDAIRPRGQGRLHHGLSMATVRLASLRHCAQQLRL